VSDGRELSRAAAAVVRANLKEALRSLANAKQRTLLAILGIVIGIGSVIGMVSIGEIVRTQAVQQFKDLGTDVVLVQLDPRQSISSASLDPALVRGIPGQVPGILEVSPFLLGSAEYEVRGKISYGQLFGADQRFFSINKLRLRAGRPVSELDANRYFCVVGASAGESLRGASAEGPVGQNLRLGGRVYIVVGEMEQVAEGAGVRPGGLNDSIIIPLTTATRASTEAQVRYFMARVDTGARSDTLTAELTGYFARRGRRLDLEVRAAEEIIGAMEKQMALYTLLLGAIGSIALIVGGIGVMNVMLISVSERRGEIGVRRALGAQESDIRWQFIIESVVLCVIGGLGGVVMGVVTSWAFARSLSYVFVVSSLAILLGFVVSTLVGVFFGYYPARQASRLDPIAALRS
jgi:putative ABC transport system permease protein